MENQAELISKLDDSIKFGDNLIVRLQEMQNIDGVPKLQRKIRQEVEFLRRVRDFTLSLTIYWYPELTHTLTLKNVSVTKVRKS